MSKIEWTEKTWNPVTGCNKVSAGCKNCYAETLALRLQRMGIRSYKNGFKLTLHEDRLHEPRSFKKPTIFFVNSMSDLFHEKIPYSFLDKVFDTIRATPRHCYQILTKRPKSMLRYFAKIAVPDNAWMGVSVEDKKHGLSRIDILRELNCATRFLSCEPLLEDLGEMYLQGIHWVIVGGESGRKARPMCQEWAESIQRQCKASDIPFFFKQWGAWGADSKKRNKKANGRLLAGREWNELPQPTVC